MRRGQVAIETLDIRFRRRGQVAWGNVVKFRQRIDQNHFYDRKSFTPAVGVTLMAPKIDPV